MIFDLFLFKHKTAESTVLGNTSFLQLCRYCNIHVNKQTEEKQMAENVCYTFKKCLNPV